MIKLAYLILLILLSPYQSFAWNNTNQEIECNKHSTPTGLGQYWVGYYNKCMSTGVEKNLPIWASNALMILAPTNA
jgi:hypothetical protein